MRRYGGMIDLPGFDKFSPSLEEFFLMNGGIERDF